VATNTFLSNETVWEQISAQVKAGRRVDAAIAYIAQRGAKLLSLRRGHRVIVDMSIATVKAGGTDPREVEKLMRRGVKVFTRRKLHAKVIVADKSVIAVSANVSNRARALLDEAGICTHDPAVIRRARVFIDRLCTEPVRPEYLQRCNQLYRPPPHVPNGTKSRTLQHRVRHARLWIVNLNESISILESESGRSEPGEAKQRSY
jgi:phosphatidylserine/phosphatidylglycerophosphate/cardiolipin synthase-like enzyme